MKGTWKLRIRLTLAMIALFAMVYIILFLVLGILGINLGVSAYALIGLLLIFIQYLMGPKLVEMSMGVKHVTREEAPNIYQMVEELALAADVPMPKIGISETNIPNAFAYGRTRRSGHICVTRGILGVVNRDELKAVLGHEMGHLKHNDMVITTLVSAIPMICYYVALSTMFQGDNDNGAGIILGLIAMVCYALGQLIVLFISRTREYYADQASVEFGNQPQYLASALYKLVYGAAQCNPQEIKDVEGSKAFFLNDVSNTQRDISEFSQVDFNRDGILGADELEKLQTENVKISTGSKIMELFSTHPDMLKRVKRLSDIQTGKE
ncbi:MAG: zinc metalloprotease HtpX [Methanobacteriaceae archaeon]|uniref:zinc metalloprotease HtpX n=1 Tax=Methanobrevibacter TaxID=2172 RepID=UPI002A141C4F|nr:zinc metalloprotease HtpX [Methanobacteriaceae archaeon]MDD3408382.1 zinc metalloprotease HtpX [Methanobacteriaceae archaeon]MDD4593786.1 zinc metalloprotease HtpX [Methanobacteriaceae archaeon]